MFISAIKLDIFLTRPFMGIDLLFESASSDGLVNCNPAPNPGNIDPVLNLLNCLQTPVGPLD